MGICGDYIMEKVRFKDIPVGTYFTRVTDRGTHNYYFKTEEVATQDSKGIHGINAVRVQGQRTGELDGFDEDIYVYVGIIQ